MRAAALFLLVHAPCWHTYLLRSCAGALITAAHCAHRPPARASAAVSAAVPRSAATIASHAADAMRNGCAHVEPKFLSGDELESARADMLSVLAKSDKFESIQTDLLNPDFRRSLPVPPFAHLLECLDELRPALAQSTGRSLLEGGGFHLMFYPISSGFMRHVDRTPRCMSRCATRSAFSSTSRRKIGRRRMAAPCVSTRAARTHLPGRSCLSAGPS